MSTIVLIVAPVFLPQVQQSVVALHLEGFGIYPPLDKHGEICYTVKKQRSRRSTKLLCVQKDAGRCKAEAGHFGNTPRELRTEEKKFFV